MMTVLFATFAGMAAFVILMSIGVLMGRKPIQGSCGGLNKINGMDECELCGGSVQKCDELSAQNGGVKNVDATRRKSGK